MYFISAYHTDIGTQKTSNQDSLLLQHADSDWGPSVLAVICDGLGGLDKGEVASAAVVCAFSDWFQDEFPQILMRGCNSRELLESWSAIVSRMNTSIANYGDTRGISLGTTLEALLLAGGKYYIFHVGDCRVYLKDKSFCQITKDQTYVQQQIDAGMMTPEQARQDPQRNMLLQCIGASKYIQPAFQEGELTVGQDFLICSDGFRHMVTAEEISERLRLPGRFGEKEMKERLVQLTELCKRRGETDNITSIWIRTD